MIVLVAIVVMVVVAEAAWWWVGRDSPSTVGLVDSIEQLNPATGARNYCSDGVTTKS